MNKCYAGIGARKTPDNVLELMEWTGLIMSMKGYCLRSGAAKGADSAFEYGCDKGEKLKEIFTAKSNIPQWGFDTVDKYHPSPSKLSDYVKRLHARNAMILLGEHGDNPVEFVVCWTPNESVTGGTGQALRIANDQGIKVYNLGDADVFARFNMRVKELAEECQK